VVTVKLAQYRFKTDFTFAAPIANAQRQLRSTIAELRS